ncbi:hypothetical protein AFM11_35120 [Mycolicibacterium wolinskyi]|uniref:Uncharacterized protein n=1 Tax=Mycolicibacterium wolinskyi TaxID=59750 RepID=A0A132PC63_9MYCO|nr:hypothetical protein [Mycolicibacterium wolinskyi]KWX19572.1 hypothetical protein AFM11_35120 [Mycolicibacterium wolinskyi]
MHTNVLAAGGIVGLGQEMFTYVVILGGLAAMALGIIVGLRASWKVGIGAGIAAFFGGILFSVLIYNAVAFRDMGVQELRDQTGYSPSIYAG